MNSSRLLLIILLFWSCNPPASEEQNTTDNEVTGITEGRSSFESWLLNPVPLVSAHRGGPYPGYPENAIETFQNIIEHTPAVIECDISMTRDSVLILMHDNTLDRTTNGEGNVADMDYADISQLLLVDNEGETTSFKIPTLDETLRWGKDNALFTLDVKRGVPFEMVIDAIEKNDAEGIAAVITYRVQDAILVHSLNKNLMISVSAGDSGALEQLDNSGIPYSNMLGFVGTREPDADHYAQVRQRSIRTILGTLGNLDKSAEARNNDEVYLQYVENGADIIATDRPIEVAAILYPKKP